MQQDTTGSRPAGLSVLGYFRRQFPSLTLSGSLSREALTAGALFHRFDTLREAGANLATPIFAGGALQAQTQAARDAFASQAATYQGVVVAALGQVTDDLWALQNDAERMAVDQHSVDIAAEALRLQQLQDAAGLLVALGGGWWKDAPP